MVLASGGFEWNAALRERFLPGPLTHPHSPPSNEGDGLAMAMAVGADLANMNESWWYPASSLPGEEYDGRPLARFVGVERTAPHSIMVNRFGQRFVNEAGNYNDIGKSFFSFDINEYAPRNLPCWVVFDQQYRSRYPVATCRPGDPDPGWLPVHDTLGGLALRAGIDPVGLAETVERWNRFVGQGRDRDFGRGWSAYDRFHGDPTAPHPNLGTVEEGPFYALPVHVGIGGDEGRAPRGRGRTGAPRGRPTHPGPLRRWQRDRQSGRAGLLRRGHLDRHGPGMGARSGTHAAAYATGGSPGDGPVTGPSYATPPVGSRRRMFELMVPSGPATTGCDGG